MFQDRQDYSTAQMIPHVTESSSAVGENCYGGGGAILSELSDEALIKQLHLNMQEKKSGGGTATSSALFTNASNTMFETSTAGVAANS